MAAGIQEQFAGNLTFVVLAVFTLAHHLIWYRRFIGAYERLVLGPVVGCTSAGAMLLAFGSIRKSISTFALFRLPLRRLWGQCRPRPP